MLAEVRRTMRRERMLQPGAPVWVAVSGGVDSMVLLHVLRALGHPCSVAHVDHGLRGEESDADRAFVEAHSKREGLPFRTVRVDPKEVEGGSVQMAARELRYAWFLELLREGPSTMALGHHRDDAVETLLLHLMRGTGTQGWQGIPPVTTLAEGRICRPMLGVGREQILAYAMEHGVAYREDASNTDPKYLRNRVRHELLPLMEALRPGTRTTLARGVEGLRELGTAAGMQLARESEGVDPGPDGILRIPLRHLRESSAPRLLLMRLLQHLEPHPDLIDQLFMAVEDGTTGAQFRSGGRLITVARDHLAVHDEVAPPPEIMIDREAVEAGADGPFQWKTCSPREVAFPCGMNTAWLDVGKLKLPLKLRPWQVGDRMRPAGLGGSKLISDILIDAGVPRHLKAESYVLLSGTEIAWLAGHRVAEGFSPDSATEMVLRLDFRVQSEHPLSR